MPSSNYRMIGGNVQYRRFAYLHKWDRDRFGLLEAVNYRDARAHLGSCFHLRQTWLTPDEEDAQGFDHDRRWQIVSSIFLNPASVAFVGDD